MLIIRSRMKKSANNKNFRNQMFYLVYVSSWKFLSSETLMCPSKCLHFKRTDQYYIQKNVNMDIHNLNIKKLMPSLSC